MYLRVDARDDVTTVPALADGGDPSTVVAKLLLGEYALLQELPTLISDCALSLFPKTQNTKVNLKNSTAYRRAPKANLPSRIFPNLRVIEKNDNSTVWQLCSSKMLNKQKAIFFIFVRFGTNNQHSTYIFNAITLVTKMCQGQSSLKLNMQFN